MKIIMTLLVRDEEDIIKNNLDFHFSQGVDHVIATDNLSVDGTPDILREYEKAGVLTYLYEDQDNHKQYAWVTRMARMAYEKFDADWVINNDADEFWWPNQGNLKDVFLELDSQRMWRKFARKFNVLSCKSEEFIPVESVGKTKAFYEHMIYRNRTNANTYTNSHANTFLHMYKVAHRGCSEIKVREGNHDVKGIEKFICKDDYISILHFPVRSYDQFVRKVVNAGMSYEKNTTLPKTLGSHVRALYEEFKRQGGLEKEFDQMLYGQDRLRMALLKGELEEDTRLKDYFMGMRD